MRQGVYAFAERSEMLPFLPLHATSFLDVGCARGAFGHGIRRTHPGARLVGIEPMPVAAREARQTYDEVVEGYFPECFSGRSERFDCIVLNDVLEHMVDPWATLGLLRRHLAPGGRIVASIPNVRVLPVIVRLLVMGRWDYTDEGTLDRTHLRFFTRGTIEELVAGAGLNVERLQGINSLSTVPRYRPLRWLLPGRLADLHYLQYAVVATADGP
jgi:2-polyprenyl-3-methyl-5-hydroxy-6-metoxy-1,4-benzoquinol methylase